MNAVEHIVEDYFRFYLKCFIMSDMKVSPSSFIATEE